MRQPARFEAFELSQAKPLLRPTTAGNQALLIEGPSTVRLGIVAKVESSKIEPDEAVVDGWRRFDLDGLSQHVRGLCHGGSYRFYCGVCRVTEQICGYSGRLLEAWFTALRERHRHAMSDPNPEQTPPSQTLLSLIR